MDFATQTAGKPISVADALAQGNQPISLMQMVLHENFGDNIKSQDLIGTNHDQKLQMEFFDLQGGLNNLPEGSDDCAEEEDKLSLPGAHGGPGASKGQGKKKNCKKSPEIYRRQIVSEIAQRSQIDWDLSSILHNGQTEWKQHMEMFIDLNAEQFWDEFLGDNAKFGLDKLQEIQGYWDINLEPWKGNQRHLDLMSPVNVWLVDKTRVSKKIDKVYKSDSKIIIQIESTALDVPYGDYFVCNEMWVIFGSDRDPKYPLVQLKQYLQVKFSKSTMFESQIVPKSEDGIKSSLDQWKNYAQENGHFQKKFVDKVLPEFLDDPAKVTSESDPISEVGLIDFSPADSNLFDFTSKPDPAHFQGQKNHQNSRNLLAGINSFWKAAEPPSLRGFDVIPFESLIDLISGPWSLTMVIPVLSTVILGLVSVTIYLIPNFFRLDTLVNYLIQSPITTDMEPEYNQSEVTVAKYFGNGQASITDTAQEY